VSAYVVVDAGFIFASLFKEAYTAQINAKLAQWELQQISLAAPVLLQYEVNAVIPKAVYQNRLAPDRAQQLLTTAASIAIAYFIDPPLHLRAFELATQFNRPRTYDTQYLALAEKLNSEFWTTDEKLYNAVQNNLGYIRWIGNSPT